MKQPNNKCIVSIINIINEKSLIITIKEMLDVEVITTIIMRFHGEKIDEYDKIWAHLKMGSYTNVQKFSLSS